MRCLEGRAKQHYRQVKCHATVKTREMCMGHGEDTKAVEELEGLEFERTE